MEVMMNGCLETWCQKLVLVVMISQGYIHEMLGAFRLTKM